MTSAKISGLISGMQSDKTISANQGTAGKNKDAAWTQTSFASMIGQNYSVQSSQTRQPELPKGTEVSGTERKFEAGEKVPVKTETSDLNAQEAKETLQEVENTFEKGVKEILKEKLDVSEEQIEQAMSELGIGYLQLMNPTDLSQLVAKLLGTDNTFELLMSEDFTGIMQSVEALTQNLTTEIGISKEELISMNNQLLEMNVEETPTPIRTEDMMTEEIPENNVWREKSEPVAVKEGEEAVTPIQTAQAEELQVPKESQAKTEATQESQDESVEVKVDEVVETPKQAPMEQRQSSTGEDAQDKHFSQNQGMETVRQTVSDFAINQQTTVEAEQMPQAAYTQNIRVEEIMQQIGEFARVHFSMETTSMELQLNPENLGKLYIHVSTTKEGNVTAQIAASNEAVKEVLETQMADLKTSLNQQGVKVDAVEVTVASHEFERNLEQNAAGDERQAKQQEELSQQRTRRIVRGELDELSGLMSEEEMLAAQIMKDHGNSMDVMA